MDDAPAQLCASDRAHCSAGNARHATLSGLKPRRLVALRASPNQPRSRKAPDFTASIRPGAAKKFWVSLTNRKNRYCPLFSVGRSIKNRKTRGQRPDKTHDKTQKSSALWRLSLDLWARSSNGVSHSGWLAVARKIPFQRSLQAVPGKRRTTCVLRCARDTGQHHAPGFLASGVNSCWPLTL
jgi:hypothetical protein